MFCSLLHLAIAKLNVPIVEQLLARGSEVNIKDSVTGDTPLHLLITVFQKSSRSSKRVLELLVIHGADVNSKNND